ncbi:MAG TPA: RNA methyltransferase [Stellaceae bacterium]
MAGTDHRRATLSSGPAVILVHPQLGENIGTAARAMFNCGLTDLRLVRPRDGWPSEKARAAASGADPVIDNARLYDTAEEAVADLHRVYATTARERHMVKRVVTPRQAAAEMRGIAADGQNFGVLFGAERAGLTNDHVGLADAIVAVPLNPSFSSLNLAQAVLLVGYEWFTAGDATAPEVLPVGDSRPATKAELHEFFAHLEEELDRTGFLRNVEKRPTTVRNVRTLFERADCTEQELRTLHGIVVALAGLRQRRRKPEGGGEGENEEGKEEA